MDLPLLCALFAAMALSFYVMLDGFDLGIGALLLLQSDESLRDHMIDSIAPTWDGNETWLIMAGVALLAAFPMAYGILLPAFYLPLIAMLLALGLRGVSFEFRVQARSGRWIWDLAFGVGSIIAALMQGVMVGGLIQGVSIRGDRFAGGVSEVFRPFALLTACAVLLGYSVLGAGWLHLKAQARLRRFAERALRVTAVAFVAAAAAVCIGAVVAQPGVGVVWRERLWPLTSICGLFIAMALALFRSIGGRRDGSPFIFGQGLFALGIAGFGLAIFPNIVPFRLTLWSAASSPLTLVFLLIGAAVVTPIVLTYSAFAYFVFRGKTPASGWEP